MGAQQRSLWDWEGASDPRWEPLVAWWRGQKGAWGGLVVPPTEVGKWVPFLAHLLPAEPLSVNGWLLERAKGESQGASEHQIRSILQRSWDELAEQKRKEKEGSQEGMLLYDFELLFALRLSWRIWREKAQEGLRCFWLVPGAIGEDALWYHRTPAFAGLRLPPDWLSPQECWGLPPE